MEFLCSSESLIGNFLGSNVMLYLVGYDSLCARSEFKPPKTKPSQLIQAGAVLDMRTD